MYLIEQDDLSEEFLTAWKLAGSHFQKMGQGSTNWIRDNLNKPFVEHLSFRIGNQLFFIFIEIYNVLFETKKEFFLSVCEEANAIPCLFRMQRVFSSFEPTLGGWGLVNAIDGTNVNPLELVSNELIPMTDWEVHDFGIKFIKNHIKNQGNEILSSQSSLTIYPNIWFKDLKNGKTHWVIVKSARHGFYPDYTDGCKTAENSKSLFATRRLIRGL